MSYTDAGRRSSKTNTNSSLQPMGRVPVLTGVYLGFVKKNSDINLNGRLQVWIPEFGSTPDDENGWVIVNYSSPFAGATNIDATDTNNTRIFEGTQTSYGMWMIPPDINNQVLVVFINGDPSRGVFIGCLYNQFMNNMVPGMAGNVNNYQYPKKFVPVAEYNKNDTKVTHPDNTAKPYEATKFKGLGNQGLIKDRFRGVTDTSARREAPSHVYGILTPGPAISKNVEPDQVRRKGGSSFIMDDGENSEYVQLATKSGAQIKINETTGFIYLINRDGTAWVQMDYKGNIDIFGAQNVSMRAQYDFNIRADRNVNIEAGQNVYIKAAQDTKIDKTEFTYDVNNVPKKVKDLPLFKYVGQGKGHGGDVVIQAVSNWHSSAGGNANLTAGGNISLGAGGSISSAAGGDNSMLGGSGVRISSGGSVDLKGGGGVRIESASLLSLTGAGGVATCSAGQLLANLPTGVPLSLPAIPTQSALSASGGGGATVKPVIEKTNILATWKDPESKFVRNSQKFKTTLSKFPTYEPCPEHENFSESYVNNTTTASSSTPQTCDQILSAVSGWWNANGPKGDEWWAWLVNHGTGPCPIPQPVKPNTLAAFPQSNTSGSGDYWARIANFGYGCTSGQTAITNYMISDYNKMHPNAPLTPCGGTGSTTVSTPDDPIVTDNSPKDLNMAALKCQLTIHEGKKSRVYLDSLGNPTGGIGHLIKPTERSSFPVGTAIAESQIDAWYSADVAEAVSGAKDIFGSIWSDLSDIRKRALVDLVFNLGKSKLQTFVRFISAMKIKNFDQAGRDLQDSIWYTQVGRRGPNIIAMIVQNIDPNGCNDKFPPEA